MPEAKQRHLSCVRRLAAIMLARRNPCWDEGGLARRRPSAERKRPEIEAPKVIGAKEGLSQY